LPEPLPGAGENRHFFGQNRARPGRGLFPELISQGHRLVADAEEEERDEGEREGPGHDQGAKVNLDEPEQRVVDREKGEPGIPREVRRDCNQESAQDGERFLTSG